MSCEEVRQLLPDYALGTLSETESASVRRHLRGCSACRAEATELDEGVSLFARAAHAADPPPELKDRVMAVLDEEWREAHAPASVTLAGPRKARVWAIRWQAVAALVIVLAGLATWGGIAQSNANRFQEDALTYRSFLGALGGKDVRVGRLDPIDGITMEGNVILYDSARGQSWILVLARAPGFTEELTVTLAGGGRTIKIPFPLRFDPDGEGWTGLVTSTDISAFNEVVLTDPNDRVFARAAIIGTELGS
jgi:hypothetical protein